MVTAVDTSVLLDVLLNDPQHSGASIAALRQAANEGSLVVCEAVLAEIVPTLAPADVKGFGYDPVFLPEGFDRTFAEMTAKEKDALSHRGKAIEILAEFLHSFSKHNEN